MLDQNIIQTAVDKALTEDIGTGDITAALIPETALGAARVLSREPMVVCGASYVNAVFSAVDKRIVLEWQVEEKAVLDAPQTLLSIKGPLRSILTAERTALNFLQTLSGIATETKRYVDVLEGMHTKLLDTRKTIPGLRAASKYAVACGGGVNHRFGLFDAVLIKENHIKACGSIASAVQAARAQNKGAFIEVEVETHEELAQALDAAPDRILLDNFSNDALKKAVQMRGNKNILLEASGNVSLSTLKSIAATEVDYISVGAITKSLCAIDLSLLVEESE